MQKLKERSLHALEYDRVLELLSGECSCSESARLVLALRPYDDVDDAQKAMLETEDACRLTAQYGGPSFYGLKDLTDCLNRAEIGGLLQMGELLKVAALLAAIRALSSYRDRTEGLSTSLDGRFDSLSPNKFLEERISNSILSEQEMADGASEQLAAIRKKIKRAGLHIREQLDKMVHSQTLSKSLQDPIVTIRGGRFVVPVKAECRSNVPGLVHDTSASGATIFVEPMGVVEANNDLKVLRANEQKEIERILREFSAQVGDFSQAIQKDMHTAIELDFIFAKARLSYKMKASAPKLSQDGVIDLKAARHPLIDPKKVVPVDIRLGGEFSTLVVTGPNTGGKTVALKTLGLLCLMAMSGLMVPASDQSRLSCFDTVLADIGDEQSIEQSLSTFSAHMVNIIDILKASDSRSLVLLDELGSGTDPVEGAALAVVILEQLREKGAKVAATTHYAELKVYALETDQVENACCEFDVATLRPTYRLLIGVPGRSNAFEISQRLGLDESVIERAKSLVSGENTKFEQVVQGLEESRQQMEAERERAQALRMDAQRDKEEARSLKQQLKNAQDRELERARTKARQILEQSRAQAQALMDDIDSLRKMKDETEADTLRELAKSQLNGHIRKLEKTADPVVREQKQEAYRLPRPLRAGDMVRIMDINKTAVVLSPTDSSGNVEVQAGIIKTRISQGKLRLLREEKPSYASKGSVHSNISRSHIAARPEIDLRGMMVEEAMLELDKFIDNAVLASLGQICIIHGKGTGALRGAVQQHLKSVSSVKSFRLGRYGEGEDGVTIAELK